MTRKCALCKATNYKRTHSFFSAPKDPNMRRKWQAAIPIANYTVTDETYVCSKHFRSCDIITHWVSGVPPHVITIKYKKFRLRTGAVPCLNFEENHDAPEMVITDQTNRRDELLGNEVNFPIQRENDAESIAAGSHYPESNYEDSNPRTKPPIRFVECGVVADQNNGHFDQYVIDNGSYKTCVPNNEQGHGSIIAMENKETNQFGNHFNDQYPEVINAALEQYSNNEYDGKLKDARILCDVHSGNLLIHNVKLEQNVQVLNEELIIPEDEPMMLQLGHRTDNAGENHDRASESTCRIVEDQELGDIPSGALQSKDKNTCGVEHLVSTSCDTMLFEDLLEIYTEVTLPRGWAFLVTSKGHTTTVVYLYMNMLENQIPVVEKEVYIKSDMVMHCAVSSKEVDPLLHNLIKHGRINKVRALSDIEELIDALDQRYICAGGPSVHNFTDIETQLAYVDGMRWRHVSCSIIVNNGSSKCSKCAGLIGIITQKKDRITGQNFVMLREKEKKIECLKRSLRQIAKRNQRLEQIRLRFKHRLRLLLANSEKTMKNRISSSDMPEIQKLMINECLKASMFKNKHNIRYSETWIFLCLMLYVESPRMYKYMFVNNYMALPSMGTIRKYFNRIKTDPQFYNLFQRSVEPYRPANEHNEEGTA